MGLFSEFIIDYNITYGEHEYSRQNKCGALANQIIRKKKSFLSCYPIDYLLVQTKALFFFCNAEVFTMS
jgi:hypothetical protein